MTRDEPRDIEQLILNEKRAIAEEHFHEAWNEARAEGIDAAIVAKAMIDGALAELASELGEKAAVELIAQVRSMEAGGSFLPARTIQ